MLSFPCKAYHSPLFLLFSCKLHNLVSVSSVVSFFLVWLTYSCMLFNYLLLHSGNSFSPFYFIYLHALQSCHILMWHLILNPFSIIHFRALQSSLFLLWVSFAILSLFQTHFLFNIPFLSFSVAFISLLFPSFALRFFNFCSFSSDVSKACFDFSLTLLFQSIYIIFTGEINNRLALAILENSRICSVHKFSWTKTITSLNNRVHKFFHVLSGVWIYDINIYI